MYWIQFLNIHFIKLDFFGVVLVFFMSIYNGNAEAVFMNFNDNWRKSYLFSCDFKRKKEGFSVSVPLAYTMRVHQPLL